MRTLRRKLFSPHGRLSRGGCWLWAVLYPGGLAILAALLDEYALGVESAPLDPDVFLPSWTSAVELNATNIISYLTIWPITVLSIKRFHDVSLSGWWVLAFLPLYFLYSESIEFLQELDYFVYFAALFAILNIGIAYIQLGMPGNIGENRYGPDPLEKD